MMGGGGFWGGYGLGSWGWAGVLLNLAITAVVFAGFIWLLVWIIRRAGLNNEGSIMRGQGNLEEDKTPEQILKIRYARGEIKKEEYSRILQDLAE